MMISQSRAREGPSMVVKAAGMQAAIVWKAAQAMEWLGLGASLAGITRVIGNLQACILTLNPKPIDPKPQTLEPKP